MPQKTMAFLRQEKSKTVKNMYICIQIAASYFLTK